VRNKCKIFTGREGGVGFDAKSRGHDNDLPERGTRIGSEFERSQSIRWWGLHGPVEEQEHSTRLEEILLRWGKAVSLSMRGRRRRSSEGGDRSFADR